MLGFFGQLSGIEKLYLVCAVIGGILFVVRLVLQFIGGGSGGDSDVGAADVGDVDVDGGFEDAGADVDDAYLSFKILSFQGLTAFFMMFGLVGLAMMRQTDQDPAMSLLAATLAGLGTVWVIGQIFRKAGSLQASGNIDLRNAVGQEAEVYLTIPGEGTGKARVTVQERLRIYEAISKDKIEIPTGQRVRVVEVTPQDVLVVEKIE
ncbi:MAG: hypothetical protein ACYTAS_04450 [Planctomycetota bacterium]|jgi:membrane protein implicated in regulation of membrane protease activity